MKFNCSYDENSLIDVINIIKNYYNDDIGVSAIVDNNHFVTSNGHVYSRVGKAGKEKAPYRMKSYFCKGGYEKVLIGKKHKPVHRMVASSFIQKKSESIYLEVNHIDGNKKNNHVKNLEWCTKSENIKHAIMTGLKRVSKGEDCSWTKVSDMQILTMKTLRINGHMVKDIAKAFNISTHYASRILNNHRRAIA